MFFSGMRRTGAVLMAHRSRILLICLQNRIRFMRISSELFPYASHLKWGYSLDFAAEELKVGINRDLIDKRRDR